MTFDGHPIERGENGLLFLVVISFARKEGGGERQGVMTIIITVQLFLTVEPNV